MDDNATNEAAISLMALAEVTPDKRTTKKDKELKARLRVNEIACRLRDLHDEMLSTLEKLEDNTTTKRVKKASLYTMKKLYLPFLSMSSDLITTDVKLLAPIGNTPYVHASNERKRNIAAQKNMNISDYRKSTKLRKIEMALASYLPESCPPQPTPRKKAMSLRKLPTTLALVPDPEDGTTYSPKELVTHLGPLSRSTRTNLMNQFIASGRVPVQTPSAVSRVIRNAKKGNKIPECWGAGRPRHLSLATFDTIVKDSHHMNGKAVLKESFLDYIREEQATATRERGCEPITQIDFRPSNKTLNNYYAYLCSIEGMSIKTSTTVKTRTRYVAENSLISSMALVSVVAATHYNITVHSHPDVEKQIKEASKGVRMFYDIIRQVNNNAPVFPVRPELIFSTDDTTDYIFEGKGVTQDPFVVVPTSHLQKSGTRSTYVRNDTKAMCGTRVKFTYTFSGAGISAPLFASTLGLTRREMPKESIIMLKVAGLCVGGGVGAEQDGWLMFFRNDNDKMMDKNRYKIYRDEVFIPFVQKIRTVFADWVEGTPIPEDLFAVSWCDGDLAQIASIIDDDSVSLYNQHLIIANKQNAARSGTEQAADLGKQFKAMKGLEKSVTVSATPLERHPLKRSITKAFSKLQDEGRLYLKDTKKKALVDFVASYPEMAVKGLTREGIMEGFLANGMVDSKFQRYPDFHKLLATCRKDPTVDEYKNCVENVPVLYQHVINNGHIPDDIFESLGFPLDMDEEGTIETRNHGISQEPRQRAKCLTHRRQIELRKERLNSIRIEQKRREDETGDKILQKLDQNKTCEEKLQKIAGRQELSELTMDHFDQCLKDELIAFILVRVLDVPKSKLPKKGKLDEAKNGENNLIAMAFDCRTKENIMHQQLDAHNKTIEHREVRESQDETPLPFSLPVPLTQSNHYSIKPATLLVRPEWVASVFSCFDPDQKRIRREIREAVLVKADLLHRILLTRLARHINDRVQAQEKRNHWCLKWAAENMAQMAAIMVLFDCVKDDLQLLCEMKTLLKPQTQYIFSNTEGDKQGAYLYFDINDNAWIRSGETTNTFRERHQQHRTGAASNHPSLNFYRNYPTKSNPSAIKNPRGYFDNLQQYTALGFDATKATVVDRLTADLDTGGIFSYNCDTKESLNRAKGRGNMSIQKKQILLVAYLAELAFDISIAAADNISKNPGFESFIGIYGGSD